MTAQLFFFFQETPWGFLLTTDSQDLNLTSYQKDGAFLLNTIHINMDQHRAQDEDPLLASLTPPQQQR